MSYKLIVSIVPQNFGEPIHEKAKTAGAGGGSIVLGRGTASNGFVQLLGLGDTSKEIVYIVAKTEEAKKIVDAIEHSTEDKKTNFGCVFTIAVPDFVKAGFIEENSDSASDSCEKSCENSVEEQMKSEYQMINVIVNKGYAEDAMAAARKAGAGGGTIINARGTAKEGDAQFFGMKIVPEKEMLIILVPSDKKADVLNAITSLACFSEAGSGIVFCNEVYDFTVLGKK